MIAGTERRRPPWVEHAALALVALALLALLVAPLATPYWWDAGAVYAPGARWLLDHGLDARPGVFPSDLSRGHTPLFYLVLALAFRALGPGPVAGHALALGFAWMAVVCTYLLGRRLFGAAAGVLAAALLLVAPLFLTMASEALPEMALTALTAAAFYALARGRLVECAVWGTLLVLIKETGVACPLAVAGAVAVEAVRGRAYREGARRVAVALVPVAVLAAFFLVQKRAEGWFVLPYHADLFHESHSLGEQLVRVLSSLVVADGRVVVLLAAVVLVGRARFSETEGKPQGRKGRKDRNSGIGAVEEPASITLLALGLHALFNLVFFTKMFFLERYTLPVHVGVVVVVAGVLLPSGARIRAWVPGLAAAAGAIAVALAQRSAGTDMASGETSFRYLHAVHAYSALYAKLAAEGGDPVVLTDWPITDALGEPYLGWVSRPFRTVPVGQGWSRWPIDRVVAVQGLGSFERLQREARERGFRRLERVEESGAGIELWGP